MSDQPTGQFDTRRLVLTGGFLVAHAVLALMMRTAPVIAMAHGIACLIVGIAIAATRPLRYIAYVTAYITGSEVLWRMTSGNVFWEFGKYAVSAVVFIGLMRMTARRNRRIAIAYFVLLLPSVLLTLQTLGLEDARQQLSFNLSGPLALMLCVIFFSSVRLSYADFRVTFVALIAPVVGIATLAYLSTATAEALEFARASNLDTSGGFGPNQVSAMLGLGLLFSILLLFERGLSWRSRAPLIAIAVGLAVQCALTFSRGGLALAFLSTFAAVLYLVRDRRVRITILILGGLMFGIGKYVVVPRLETFTAGKLSERYSSVDPSGRGLLAGYDLEIFSDNPLLGVGPGVATNMRRELGHLGAAHTEFTRMLAEHGVFGAIAIVLLVVLSIRTLKQARTLEARAFVAAMLLWFAGFLAINAMRLVAPSFLLGLSCAVAFSSIPRTKSL